MGSRVSSFGSRYWYGVILLAWCGAIALIFSVVPLVSYALVLPGMRRTDVVLLDAILMLVISYPFAKGLHVLKAPSRSWIAVAVASLPMTVLIVLALADAWRLTLVAGLTILVAGPALVVSLVAGRGDASATVGVAEASLGGDAQQAHRAERQELD